MHSGFISFAKKNTVLFVAIFAAVLTSLFVPIDKNYVGYFDWRTLTCLFCVSAVISALRNIHFFYSLARRIVESFKTARLCITALVFITFVGSMIMANDMALLTFLPLGFYVLDTTDSKSYMAFTFIMQNIAANLGGMLTPFGNPQNLYLYSKFNIPDASFLSIMAPPFAVSLVLILACCLFIPKKALCLDGNNKVTLPIGKTVFYLLLFVFAIIIVFRKIPYWTGLIVIPMALLILDRKALLKIDYPLLLTFFFFFIFSGNLARIDAVKCLFSFLLKKSTILFSIFSCQIISNVPSAVLLSQFTDNYRELLLGVNLGGLGTLIASLASLITFREYTAHNPGRAWHYLGLFSLINFSFLLILTVLMMLL